MKRDRRFLIGAFSWLMALSPRALAGEIVGRVVLSREPAADVVVSIDGLKLEGPPDAGTYIIDHLNLNFVPHVLAVRAGSTVQFRNSDGMPCRIYSISSAGVFVLGRRDGGPTTVTFDRPGVIEVRCANHARQYAYVVVTENPYFSVTNAEGRYEIQNVPPGRYTLQAWYEGKVLKNKTIHLRAEKLTIDFQAPRPQPGVRGAGPAGPSSSAVLPGAVPDGVGCPDAIQ